MVPFSKIGIYTFGLTNPHAEYCTFHYWSAILDEVCLGAWYDWCHSTNSYQKLKVWGMGPTIHANPSDFEVKSHVARVQFEGALPLQLAL